MKDKKAFRKKIYKMLNNKIINSINQQIQKELYSSYLYLEMANYYEEKGLKGFAQYFVVQAQEERDHALYFRDYLLLRNARVISLKIDEPYSNYQDIREPLVLQIKHEQEVTKSISDILDIAIKEKDFATQEFLQWFIKEQAEEESKAENLLTEYDFVSDNKAALIVLDGKLATRIYQKVTPVLA